MLEEVIYYENSKYGIISYPIVGGQSLPLFVFLNAGLINRQGPNRIYVKMSRELNNIGFTCFRFDLPGIGDHVNSSKSTTKSEMYFDELRTIINYFRKSKGVYSFILCGLCTGADLAYDYALEESTIAGVCMINGTKTPQNPGAKGSIRYRYYKKYLTDGQRLAKYFTPKKLLKIPRYFLIVIIILSRKLMMLLASKNKVQKEVKEISSIDLGIIDKWRRLLNSNVKILQIASEGSESYDFVKNLSKGLSEFNASRDNYREYIIYDADHTFTSVTSQQDLTKEVVKWSQHCFIKRTPAISTIQ